MQTAKVSKIQKGFDFEYVVETETEFGKLILHFNTVNALISYLNNCSSVEWSTWE